MIAATHHNHRVTTINKPGAPHLFKDAAILDTVSWYECGGSEAPLSVLLAHLIVLGQSLHLEAIEVKDSGNGTLEAVNSGHQGWIDSLYEKSETSLGQLTINDGHYVVHAYPYEA